jgi:hypothetical protein
LAAASISSLEIGLRFCDLAERAGDQGQQVDGLGKAIARHVPGGGRHAQAQFLGQRLLHLEALVAQ